MKKVAFSAVLLVAASIATAYFFARPPATPDFTAHSLAGERVSAADLRGKVVLVNFWATTCAICLKEMPALVDTWKRFHPRGFETLAVAMPYDNPEWVRHYTARARLPFTVLHDQPEALTRAFGNVQVTPVTFLLDRQGRIAERIIGEPDFKRLHARIEGLLTQAVP